MLLHAINQAARATAFCERFFGFAETALAPSPALVKSTDNSGNSYNMRASLNFSLAITLECIIFRPWNEPSGYRDLAQELADLFFGRLTESRSRAESMPRQTGENGLDVFRCDEIAVIQERVCAAGA